MKGLAIARIRAFSSILVDHAQGAEAKKNLIAGRQSRAEESHLAMGEDRDTLSLSFSPPKRVISRQALLEKLTLEFWRCALLKNPAQTGVLGRSPLSGNPGGHTRKRHAYRGSSEPNQVALANIFVVVGSDSNCAISIGRFQ